MKILIDLHHADLYYSLYCLLEKRLGFELYRPIGIDWFNEGYWKIAEPYNNSIDTINQFLESDLISPERYHASCGYYNHSCKDDIYHIYNPIHDYYQKAIKIETFKNLKFDLIISTIEAHDYAFEKLRDKYQPSAKLIAQLGNTLQKTHCKNVIHSVPYTPQSEQNCILMHQEINTNLYTYITPDVNTKNIYSVVSLAPYLEIYNEYKNILDICNFKYYGINCPDGILDGALGVSEKIKEANLGWCLKHLGGLGHSNMGWMCSGRPIITNMSQHRFWGGNALKLFEPDYNCIDIESDTTHEISKKIKKWLEPEINIKMGENAKKRFHEIINYDEEEMKFRKFMSNIL